MQTEQIEKLVMALAKAQSEIEGAAKTGENPHFKSRYADLASVRSAMSAPFAKYEIATYQRCCSVEGELRLVTRIMHKDQWIEDDGIPLLMVKHDMQGLGSAMTYARRYGLMAAAGIAPEDDDGNKAVGDGPSMPIKSVKRGTARADTGPAEAKAKEIAADISKAESVEELGQIWLNNQTHIRAMPNDIRERLVQQKDELKTAFDNAEAA